MKYKKISNNVWKAVGRKYVYIIIDFIDCEKEYKIEKSKYKEIISSYDFENNDTAIQMQYAFECENINQIL